MRLWRAGIAVGAALLLGAGGWALALLYTTPEPILGEPIHVTVDGPLPVATPGTSQNGDGGAGLVPVTPPSPAGNDDDDDDDGNDDDNE